MTPPSLTKNIRTSYTARMVVKNSSKVMLNVMSNPRYKGRHIVVVKGKVFTAGTGKQVNKLLDRLELQYPHDRIALTYIPRGDTLILLWL
jgi:hypothetical protein